MWSAATAEISWLLEVLQLEKSSWYAVTFEDFQILKIRRKELLRKNHPDKCVDDDKKEAVQCIQSALQQCVGRIGEKAATRLECRNGQWC